MKQQQFTPFLRVHTLFADILVFSKIKKLEVLICLSMMRIREEFLKKNMAGLWNFDRSHNGVCEHPTSAIY